MIKVRFSDQLATILLGCCTFPALAIPPPPPAQAGSLVGTYYCGAQTVKVTKSWDYKISPQPSYGIQIGSIPLSEADAQLLDREIRSRGPFQATSVYCLNNGAYELAFYRYTPTDAMMRINFVGTRIKEIK